MAAFTAEQQAEFYLGVKVDCVSSNVAWAKWDGGEDVLTLGFKDDSIYTYFPVGPELAEDFAKATSKGQWRWKHFPQGAPGVTCLVRGGHRDSVRYRMYPPKLRK